MPRSQARHSTVYVPGPIGIAGEPTAEEWKEMRDAIFDELRKYSIPENLIQAVQDFRPHARVEWVKAKGNPPSVGDLVQPIIKREQQPTEKEPRSDAPLNVDQSQKESLPATAGDALAIYLRVHLGRLRSSKSAPVRHGKMMPRSTMATIAMDTLESYQLFGHVPGDELINLLRELLDIDKPKLQADRQFTARYQASWILAQQDVGTRVLARTLGVDASSISRWRRDPDFRKLIEDRKKTIIELERQSLWPPKLKDDDRVKLEARRNALVKLRDLLKKVPALRGLLQKGGRDVGSLALKHISELERFSLIGLGEINAEVQDVDEELAGNDREAK
jgi:hypothetical protein